MGRLLELSEGPVSVAGGSAWNLWAEAASAMPIGRSATTSVVDMTREPDRRKRCSPAR
jgi:hypothetical protein